MLSIVPNAKSRWPGRVACAHVFHYAAHGNHLGVTVGPGSGLGPTFRTALLWSGMEDFQGPPRLLRPSSPYSPFAVSLQAAHTCGRGLVGESCWGHPGCRPRG